MGTRARRPAVVALAMLMGGWLIQPAQATGNPAPGVVFSDPVYWPLRVESRVDCTMSNPGCPLHHTFWGVDVIPTGQRDGRPASQAGVFAMGAGIAHIGEAHGHACGTGDKTDFGTWVWVDHGGGVVSKYGHLSQIAVRDGQPVAAGDRLGTVGNTGDSSKLFCDETYLDFQVRHNGVQGPSVPFSTKGVGEPDGNLLACAPGGVQAWPLALGVVRRIDDMPKHYVLPAGSDSCLPVPRTAMPGSSGMRWVGLNAGTASLAVSWSPAGPGVDAIRVELGKYHPEAHQWDECRRERHRDLPRTATAVVFDQLDEDSTYRAMVWFHDTAGWQPVGTWVSARAN